MAVTCRVLGISRQPYYRWLNNPVTASEVRDAHQTNALIDAHREDPQFGYRFLADQARAAGKAMSVRSAWRLCRDAGISSSVLRKRRGKSMRPGPPVHDDRVQRAFTAVNLNELWLTDITEHHTSKGKLYLCAIKDVCSNRIVGYSIDSKMTSRLAVAALRNAVARHGRDVAGCVVHSDPGSQFRSRRFVAAINQFSMIGSMGRVGTCADNAAMESFFSLLQKNV